ncbi:hypothetical protein E2C01_090255 [Portunus trituberculatus]|uniref:Uncharacterized protein n=1 Tax=Portunus trituberculatus TaxID=210409 RepID=A0A5B7JE76_PORTR|nr:hypothetical protein [Portunus trituberculatus]
MVLFPSGIPLSLPKADQACWGGSLQPLPIKRSPQLSPDLEVEVRVDALGVGEPLATTPIWFCCVSKHADPSGAKASEGHAHP